MARSPSRLPRHKTDGGRLEVTLTDAAGNTSLPGTTDAPDLAGPSARQFGINDDGTVLTGRRAGCEDNTVTDADGVVVGTVTVGATGNFSIPLNPAQTDGRDLRGRCRRHFRKPTPRQLS